MLLKQPSGAIFSRKQSLSFVIYNSNLETGAGGKQGW